MDCCDPDVPDKGEKTPHLNACPVCMVRGFQVSSRTVFHHILPQQLSRISDDQYFFCNSSECNVVYFSKIGDHFETRDLREQVSIKASHLEDFPICYCFGFYRSDIRNVSFTKAGPVSEIVRNLIARRLCDCEIRNPSSRCCLAEILGVEVSSE